MVNEEISKGYKIAICDDEQIHIKRLQEALAKTGREFEIFVFTSGEDLLNAKEEFQMIFLDVMMEGLNGFQTAEKLRDNGFQGLILFQTSYIDNFTEAFRVKAFRYLLKPIQTEKLEEALQAAEWELMDEREIYVTYKGVSVFIKCREIVCIKAQRDECVIYDIFGREHISNKGIGYWNVLFSSQSFFQVHKSYLIAMRYVTGFLKKGYISLQGVDFLVPVSKRLITDFKKAHMEYIKKRGTII